MFDTKKPYNDLPDLPPDIDINSPRILLKLVSASRALASLSSSRALPNQTVLLNSVFIREAKESSEVENIITTDDELFQAMAEPERKISGESKEVLHYVEAVWCGMELIKTQPLCTNIFIKIVQTIKKNAAGIRQHTGTNIKNEKTGEIVYIPPEGESIIRQKLYNLEKFLHGYPEVDPLIKMAVAHYQFEAIHPFGDGNGRTGRIINLLYLVQTGLLKKPILYLSKYILDNKTNYYSKLKAVTEANAWEDWILYMLDAIEQTAIFTEKKIEEIFMVIAYIKIKMRENKLYSKDLLDVLFHQPYCKAKFLIEAGVAKEQTARKYLEQLEKIGILRKLKVGRENLFINQEFLRVLITR